MIFFFYIFIRSSEIDSLNMALIIQSSLQSGFKKTHLKWFHMLKQGLHVMICWVKDAIGFFFIYWYYLWHVYKACLFGTFLRLNRHLRKSKVSVNVSIQMGKKRACLCEHLPINLYLSGVFLVCLTSCSTSVLISRFILLPLTHMSPIQLGL